MAKATAVIVGATGAVGRKLTPLLAGSGRYAKVIVLHRRPSPFAKLARIEERMIDFARLAAIPAEAVDAVFCCIGTTQKKAGSTEAFQSVDRDLPWRWHGGVRPTGAASSWSSARSAPTPARAAST
jgi:uncharacterized protein YbjT (DUF2867 family)